MIKMAQEEREKFESFMAERFPESIDRRRCLNGDDNDYMSWDMNVARTVWAHLTSLENHIADAGKVMDSEVFIGVFNPEHKEVAIDMNNSGIRVVELMHWHCWSEYVVVARKKAPEAPHD